MAILQSPLFTVAKSSWTPPRSFQDLTGAESITVDLETFDPGLLDRGPGGARGEGHVVGVALGTPDGFRGYYPFRHANGTNFDEGMVKAYVKKQLSNNAQPKIGANCPYEMEWLEAWGVKIDPSSTWIDIQVAEALLDEEKDRASVGGYSLDAIAKLHLGEGKDETLLNQAAGDYGVSPKSGLHILPAQFVGPYAEADVDRTARVWQVQKRLLEQQDLGRVFDMETKLAHVLLAMRMRGVRVDLEKAKQVSQKLRGMEDAAAHELSQKAGKGIDVWSNDDIAKACRNAGVDHPVTEKGNPSFTKQFLEQSQDPFFKLITKVRTLNRLRETFVDGTLLKHGASGRIYAQFNAMLDDDGGTRTGRLSSSNPNLQQIPARSEFAYLVRECFLPEEGQLWAKSDYSQQEFRVLVHYACCRNFGGAREIAQMYKDNPKTDFHQMVAEMASIQRGPAKNINFGIVYGVGLDKLCALLGLSNDAGKALLLQYHQRVPFVRDLSQDVSRRASTRGFITTLGGRKRHFDYWESTDWDSNRGNLPMTRKRAEAHYGNTPLRRAGTHKALNALIQGGSADMMKMAMIDLFYNHGVTPLITVHDELGLSVDSREQAEGYKAVMENVVKLTVPIVADLGIGKTWGSAK